MWARKGVGGAQAARGVSSPMPPAASTCATLGTASPCALNAPSRSSIESPKTLVEEMKQYSPTRPVRASAVRLTADG